MRLFILFLGIALLPQLVSAQRVSGTVFDAAGNLLPFSSITVKGTSVGASANDKANFSFTLEPGSYTLVAQRIGYTAVEKRIDVKKDMEITFILPDQNLVLDNVVVKTGGEDPAYAIIRNAIKKRDFYANQVDEFSCDLYSKDLIKLRNLPKRVFGQKIEDEDIKSAGLDSAGKGIVYLGESLATVKVQKPDKVKLFIKHSRVSGSNSFGVTFPTFINFYSNNVSVFSESLNPRGFVSPIADGAIGFYKFKFLGNFWENNQAINVIEVTPRRAYEPLFKGIINITDGDWRIHSADLLLTKTAQLEILDTMRINQLYVPVTKDVWKVKNQVLYFNFNQFKIDAIGTFLSVYSDYDVEPGFDKKTFDRVLIKYDSGVSKKPKAFWDSIRPVPLEREEELDYKVKDSTFKSSRDSMMSRRNIDSLNKNQKKIGIKNIFWTGVNRSHFYKVNEKNLSSYSYGIEGLIKSLEYNFAEGLVLQAKPYFKTYLRKAKTSLAFEPTVRYGLSNNHLNGWMDIKGRSRGKRTESQAERLSWTISGGKRVSSFNKATTLTAFDNSINSILWGNNFLKTYENYFGSFSIGKRYENGLQLSVGALYEDRIPLYNTTDFVVFQKDKDKITPNYPVEQLNTQFTRHQAVIMDASISFQPGQRYIQFPTYRMSIGSDLPTFSLKYSKGISKFLGSDVDFDKWAFNIKGDKNFKLLGATKYKVEAGGFLNNKSVFFQDYTHYDANYSPSDFARSRDFLNGFQLPLYYAYSNKDNLYATAFLEHHLNGLLTNKIPLFKRLKWNLVAGGNAVFLKNTNYVEGFVGLENIFKIFRLDVVSGFENGKYITTGLRLGAGGILGGALNSSSGDRGSGNSVSIGF